MAWTDAGDSTWGIEKVPFLGKNWISWRRRFSPSDAQEHAEQRGVAREERRHYQLAIILARLGSRRMGRGHERWLGEAAHL